MIEDRSRADANHELKFVFENSRASVLIKWLELRCQPDPDFPTGKVSSIYYDTLNWRYLNEKINSDFLKTKIRIRWYEDINTGHQGDQSFLEAKYKIGSSRKKKRVATEYSGKWLSRIPLSDPKLIGIPFLLCELGVKIPPTLFPAFQISYKRFRFIEPLTGSRLCIDFDIGMPRTNWHMLPKTGRGILPCGVFEVKGSQTELPGILRQLTAMGCRKESFSKYSGCVNELLQV